MAFVFYDTETSGTGTTFDQILQFAAILTDDDLNELDSFSIRCRRLPHVVPSPMALIVTGVRPTDISENPVSHYSMMLEIRRKLQEWSLGGAVFMGYNSIKFDEPMLRQAFYQTLLPIYQTNTNGNTRADVMRMAQACSVYAPNAIAVPVSESGRRVFKLGQIAQANGIRLDNAHEALSDARATLGVARLIRDRAPNIWTLMLRNSRKPGVETALRDPVVCFTEFYFGSPYNFMVTEAARNPNDGSEVALFDLAYDPEPYVDLPEQELLPLITGKVKLVRCIRANAQPMLFSTSIAPENLRGDLLAPEVYEARATMIRNHFGFQTRLSAALTRRFEDQPASPHVEARIYDGFPDQADTRLMSAFHDAEWEDRPALCDRFRDARCRELGQRLIYFERPELLSSSDRARHEAWVGQRLTTDEEVPWTTVSKSLQEVSDLKQQADAEGLPRLVEIEDFLSGLVSYQAVIVTSPERSGDRLRNGFKISTEG